VIITLPLFLAGLQIGSKVASTLLEEKNPKLAKNIETLVGSFTAGAQGMSSLTKAFGSPNIAQTPTSTEGSGLQIKPPINNEGVQQGIFNRPRNILGIPGQEDSMYNIFGA